MKNGFYVLIFLFGFLGFFVLAQNGEAPPGVTFPVAELGNCASKSECEAYCDLPENAKACLDFAAAHNLIPEEEIELARRMLALGETSGPGGCRGKAECEIFCDDISHIEECIAFAERNGLIPPEELEEGKKVAQAIKQGIKPPNCKNKSECDVYCMAPENMKECITFARAAELMPPEELEEVEKVLAAIEKGAIPPPCRGREDCDEYCSAPENFETCITFAEAAGFVSSEEAAMARRTGGKGPGDCRGKEQCEAYCEDPANAEACINFAVEFGFMSPEEAEPAKKMLAAGLTTGPGGCKGKEECESYCDDLSHMTECVDFAEKAGFISPEDAARARKMAEMGMTGGPGGCKGEEECQAFCENPANAQECLDFAVRVGDMSSEEAQQVQQRMEMIQTGGPGGCKSEEECKRYCDDPTHGQECLNFAVQQGIISPGMMQPVSPGFPSGLEGKCANEQECIQYCLQSPQDSACQVMMGPQPEGQMPPLEGQQMPSEITPPPGTESAPQSFFDQVQNFLASVISISTPLEIFGK